MAGERASRLLVFGNSGSLESTFAQTAARHALVRLDLDRSSGKQASSPSSRRVRTSCVRSPACVRISAGQPWIRLAVILVSVALFAVFAALLFEARPLRRRYPRRALV